MAMPFVAEVDPAKAAAPHEHPRGISSGCGERGGATGLAS